MLGPFIAAIRELGQEFRADAVEAIKVTGSHGRAAVAGGDGQAVENLFGTQSLERHAAEQMQIFLAGIGDAAGALIRSTRGDGPDEEPQIETMLHDGSA